MFHCIMYKYIRCTLKYEVMGSPNILSKRTLKKMTMEKSLNIPFECLKCCFLTICEWRIVLHVFKTNTRMKHFSCYFSFIHFKSSWKWSERFFGYKFMLIKILSYRRTFMKSTEGKKKLEKNLFFSQYNLRIDKQTTSHEIVAFFMLSTFLFCSPLNFFFSLKK